MNRITSIFLYFSCIFLLFIQSLIAQVSTNNVVKEQQHCNLSLCDMSEIVFYNPNLKDTLIGKGVILLTFDTIKCNDLNIIDGEIVLLSLNTKNGNVTDRLFEYKSEITKDLSDEEHCQLRMYEILIYNVFVNRGICNNNNGDNLIVNKMKFFFGFKVIPSKILKNNE